MTFDPAGSVAALEQYYREASIDPASAPFAIIIARALDFYATTRPSGLADDPQADMLLFQFGTYDWGQGESFEIGLTRQFIVADEIDDDAISQLHCTTFFAPTLELKASGNANRWCRSQAELPEFRAFVLSSDAYRAALAANPTRCEIRWEPV